MFAQHATVTMDGYKGDEKQRIGRVESGTVCGVITLECLARSTPEQKVYRSYFIDKCKNLRVFGTAN